MAQRIYSASKTLKLNSLIKMTMMMMTIERN